MRVNEGDITKWNAQAGNGFRFDVQAAIYGSVKQLKKEIRMDEGNMLKVELRYASGLLFGVDGRCCVPCLYFREWHTDGCVKTSSGPGQYVKLAEPQKRKNFQLLVNISCDQQLDDENLKIVYMMKKADAETKAVQNAKLVNMLKGGN